MSEASAGSDLRVEFVVDQIEKNEAHRSIGLTARKHRIDEAQLLLSHYYKKLGLSEAEVQRRIVDEFDPQLVRNPLYRKWWELLQPTSTTRPRNQIRPLVETAAVLRLKEIAWLRTWLETHEGPGRKAGRLPIAAFFSMALEGGPPDFQAVTEKFREANAARGWAYWYPECQKRSAANETLHSRLNDRDPRAMLHVQVALIRQLASIVDDPSDNQRPRVGQYLFVDGTQQQAHVRQVFGVDDEHNEFLHGDFEDIKHVLHVTKDGRELKRNHGHNIVAVTDGATGLPLVYAPFPANVDERVAATALLQTLFEIWPDCPAEFIVGDSLYDHSIEFMRSMEDKWALHPVCAQHGGHKRKTEPYRAIDGVPECPHSESGFMKREKDDYFYAGKKRRKAGRVRGEDPPRFDARIRWTCPAGICPNRDTYFRDDPRLHRYVPLAGHHRLYFVGQVLLTRRNIIESNWAQIKRWFYGSGAMRIKWAKTRREAFWAYGLPLLGLTAKRLVHATGAYGELLEEAEKFHLLSEPSLSDPAPGPSPLSVAAAGERWPVDPQPPASWEAVRLDLAF